MLKYGWIDAVEQLDITPMVNTGEIEGPVMHWSDEGTEIDIAAYLSGEPEYMGMLVNMPTPRSLIRIGVDNACHSGVSPETMLTVGRSVLTVVESLRMRGYPCEIWACQSVNGNGGTWDGRILIQAAHSPVHVGRLAFWLAHPAALRRAWFALESACTDEERDTFSFQEGGWYGYPNPNFAKPDFDEWAPSAQNGIDAVTRWVANILERRA